MVVHTTKLFVAAAEKMPEPASQSENKLGCIDTKRLEY